MQSIKWRKRSTFQEATNNQIEYVEEKLKIKFPTDYREFIKDHNGCSPIDKKGCFIPKFSRNNQQFTEHRRSYSAN
ncbi:SMI1/KNR4 family protein [Bacillus subtilis]|uniref:SMI1/KNR4 family protein n=1 Tax=Bacillus subtilis TaxID=1423 RepID=UPI0008659B2F|nr:SMI1/KNR4 family protein [Bacillus subtilis]AOR98941.1 hypothetical protein BSBS38_02663 [Bacillus subtilis]MDV3519981.1 SMI1/KNR4 family protein [Bacillus subtilis subsp. subtilis]UWI99938.1 SMI1/KNR4 family protein [Bacillus subtilis]WOP26046.1 SMI1/KNR4 family protein [Bacillus subtilis]